MARVAANQDRAEAARSHYIYVQHAHVVSRKGQTVMCEETTDFRIAPSPRGSHADLLKLKGRMLVKNKYVAYDRLSSSKDESKADDVDARKDADAGHARPGDAPQSQSTENPRPPTDAGHDGLTVEISDDSTDRDLVENLRANLLRNNVGERKTGKPEADAGESSKAPNGNTASSDAEHGNTNENMKGAGKDGMDNSSLFPLTSTRQKDYAFRLLGNERMNGRDVYHLTFRPRDRKDFGWKGDAYIDRANDEPVVITTDMARKIPIAVRTLLGTNVPGLGFTIVYAPQSDGVWFPVSFSTEFKLHVLFFFSREILIDAKNRDFEKTHVTARVVDADPSAQDPTAHDPATY